MTLFGGNAVRRARSAVRQVTLASLALTVWNLGLAAFLPEKLEWASFPLSDAAHARAGVALGAAAIGVLAIRLPTRGFFPWAGITSILTWAVAGFIVMSSPSAPPPGIVPPLLVLVFLAWHRRDSTARSTWARDPRRAGTIYVLVASLIASVIAVRALGDHFSPPVDTWVEALYFVVITFGTIGYGDVVPVTPLGQMLSTTVVILAFIGFALAAGVLVPALVRTKFKELFKALDEAGKRSLKDHVVIAGGSPESVVIVSELRRRETPFVLVHGDQHFLDEFEAVDFQTVQGDAADAEVLDRVNLKRARGLVACTGDDAKNAFIVLAARQIVDEQRIVAMATDRENVEKLRLAGADIVVSPASVGGSMLAHAVLGEGGSLDELIPGDATLGD